MKTHHTRRRRRQANMYLPPKRKQAIGDEKVSFLLLKAKPTGDVAFEFGVRFHVVPNATFEQGQIMIAWEWGEKPNGPCAALVSFNEPWPKEVNIDRVTAVFVKPGDLIQALGFVGAQKHGLRH